MTMMNQGAGPSELHKQVDYEAYDSVPALQNNLGQNEMAEQHDEKQNFYEDDDDVEMKDE